jgi:superfamily II DNA/RNA helicase
MHYQNNYQRRGGRPSFNRGRSNGRSGGFGGGARRIKTFDPSQVVSFTPVQDETPEYVVKNQFSDFAISDRLKENINVKGYKIPTPIQDQTIPAILEGRDLIGMANTGTGKTAAFLIPLIEKVLKDRNQKVLIVTPTRELAAQIKDELYSLTSGLSVYSALCIGGANMWRQKEDLRRNPSFVIGTPGRLDDLIRTRNLNLGYFNSVVLDEADHMVDVGFFEPIKRMIGLLPRERQSLFFSATVNDKVKGILQSFVRNPVTVSVKTADITTQVKQEIVRIVSPNTKINELNKLLAQEGFDKVLIFGRTKRGVQKLSDSLNDQGFRADAIHGNKNQSQRVRTLDKFKQSVIKILIATDVASRGLDIPNVSHVINFDLPESYEAYIHRIGRTGRADKKGIALTFVE